MQPRSWLPVLGYGALAAVLLACLWLVSLAPLRSSWGRELSGGAIAIIAVAVGLRMAQRTRHSHPPPAASAADVAPPVAPGAAASPRSAAPATPEGAAADAPSLSVREREVLGLLAQGLSNKELARALSLSENTVKTHLANLYAKLGVGKRTEALAAARRFGLDGLG